MSLGRENDFEEELRDEVLQAIAALRSARENELRILVLRGDVGIGSADGELSLRMASREHRRALRRLQQSLARFMQYTGQKAKRPRGL